MELWNEEVDLHIPPGARGQRPVGYLLHSLIEMDPVLANDIIRNVKCDALTTTKSLAQSPVRIDVSERNKSNHKSVNTR